MLPPVGVVVERDGEPLGALWCYESCGIGVAFLEWPCSAPGLGQRQALEVFRMAVDACVALAKNNGDYSIFRCSTLPAIARVLPRLGFRSEGGARENFIMRRD
jgi:hypothetical protein